MVLSELLANEELRQHEFPVVRDKIFLAHAGVCPLPHRVAEAIGKYAAQCRLGDQETLLPVFQMHQTRQLAAQLLGAQPDETAFVGPTSLALSFVAAGLHLRKQDTVLCYFDDYPSNVYPWMALSQKGVQARFINASELGRIRPTDVLSQIDEHTRLVALSSCHYLSGYRTDLQAIGEALHQRGIMFCVDAIQTLGAFPTTVEHIDFLAADAHKWMLGPCAAGIMFVRKTLQQYLHPPVYGWNNVRCPEFIAQEQLTLRASAQRYEAGTANLFGMVGLQAALELLLQIGIQNIAHELLRKRSWLVPALRAKGYTVLNADAPQENASAIIALRRPGTDTAALHHKLMSANIVTSLRSDRAGRRFIRLSPHFYNTDAELHRLLEML